MAEDTTFLAETAFENEHEFLTEFDNCSNDADVFLHRDSYISFRSTSVDLYEQEMCLSINYDIDGVVMELENISGLSAWVTYFQLLPKAPLALRNMYGILKKHLNLNDYSQAARRTLRACLGFQLFSGTDGFETWLGIVPKCNLSLEYDSDIIRRACIQSFNNLKVLVQNKLQELVATGLARNTLAKNNLSDLSKLRILPDDQDIIFRIIDECLKVTEVYTHGLEFILVTFRFGDKCRRPLKLPIRRKEAVRKITVHVGIDVAASIPAVETHVASLFWSKTGLQEIVGRRGTLTTAYGFTECGNYQSNLDGRTLGIDTELRSVCVCGDSLNFVQFYADTPHRYPDSRFHPVSAAIIVMKGVTKRRTHLDADAKKYISEMRNNFELLHPSTCRLEFVAALPSVPEDLVAEKLIDEQRLRALFQNHSLFVPVCGERFSSCLKNIGLYLTDRLEKAYLDHGGTGLSKAVWESYQSELAVEKLLYGRPLCSISRVYSINLGPGVGYPSRSKSDSNGFLCLDDPFSCCEDENSHPPLCIYSKSEIVKRQIKNCFGVLDFSESSKAVLGRRLVWTLLNDFHQVGRVYFSFHDFLCSLKLKLCGVARQRVVGGCTVNTLTEQIASMKKAKYPMVTSAVIHQLQENGVNVISCLKAGIEELELGYFPAFRTSDSQRHQGLHWMWTFGVWVIVDVDKCPKNSEGLARYLAPAVVGQLEQLQLCHASTLRDRNLPWLAPCIAKLSEVKLSKDDLIIVLTFITCIARLMGGHYIDFDRLSLLEMKLPKPITQHKLKQLEIQSKYLLQNFNKFRLWRLHHSVAFRLKATEKVVSSTARPQDVPEEPHEPQTTEMEDIVPPSSIRKTVEEEEISEENMQPIVVRHVPTNCYKIWSAEELEIITKLREGLKDLTNIPRMYQEYQKICRCKGIPDRSVASFKAKLYRL